MAACFALLGLASFLAHDFERAGLLRRRVWRAGFWLGLTLWVFSAGWTIVAARAVSEGFWRQITFGIAALIFLGLEIYALFFALPFEKTYLEPGEKRRVCRTGLYGLCRHPGFWSFAGLCLSAALALNTPRAWINLALLTACNLIYIVIQDKWIFVREFSDYPEYQKEVPFLLPRRQRR